MNKGHILVIEDDKSIINFLNISLKTNDYKVDIAQNGLTGIIVISARGQDEEKVEALDLGADDFVTKPFSIHELLARIRVGFRKVMPDNTVENVYETGNLKIDYERRQVFVDQELIHLTPIEYKILLLLVKNAGKVLTHRYLQNEVWGYTDEKECQSLRVFMANIRKKIEKDTNHPEFIVTEVGVGYRFVGK